MTAVIAPPFHLIRPVADSLRSRQVRVFGQNGHAEPNGAYTGEISAAMLKDLGVKYAIIGHSERRQYFGETNETVNKKVGAALKHGLRAIVCVGENLEQYDAGQTGAVVGRQVREGLQGLATADAANIVVAYEPVWAIGTGRAAGGAGAIGKSAPAPGDPRWASEALI